MIVTVPTIKRKTESVWKDSDKKYYDSLEKDMKESVKDISKPEEYEAEVTIVDGYALCIESETSNKYYVHEIKVSKHYGKLDLEIDTSFKANMKFDKYFADTLKCSLNEYIERISKYVKKPNTAKSHMLSLLKFLYCYVNSDKLPTFEDFCGMFDYELANKIIAIIGTVLKEVGNTISKN